MRTTIDIDDPILRDLKRLQKKERKTLGRLVSELLADALHRAGSRARPTPAWRWVAKPMGAKIDLADKAALWAALDDESTRR